MVLRRTVALLVLLVVGCSPVYWFQTPTPEGLNADQRRMRAQLAEVLRGQGFQNRGAYYRASSDLACGLDAPDRQTFQKSWRGETLWMPSFSWVWVQDFSCDGHWSAVILTSGADEQAEALRALLDTTFADDIAAGRLTLETTHRLALE